MRDNPTQNTDAQVKLYLVDKSVQLHLFHTQSHETSRAHLIWCEFKFWH